MLNVFNEWWPFLGFAIVMTGTPGPNNAMVLTSATRIGVKRTLPLVLGVSTGVSVMLLAMAFGLNTLLIRLPLLDTVLRVLAAVVMTWIAWKILTAGPVRDHDERRLLGFAGGVGFQWINPKAWAMTASAASLFMPPPVSGTTVLLHAVLMWLTGTCLVSLWATAGSTLRRPLQHARFAHTFNASMAILLMLATLPVLLDRV